MNKTEIYQIKDTLERQTAMFHARWFVKVNGKTEIFSGAKAAVKKIGQLKGNCEWGLV